jgi:hypothetical protein
MTSQKWSPFAELRALITRRFWTPSATTSNPTLAPTCILCAAERTTTGTSSGLSSTLKMVRWPPSVHVTPRLLT